MATQESLNQTTNIAAGFKKGANKVKQNVVNVMQRLKEHGMEQQ